MTRAPPPKSRTKAQQSRIDIKEAIRKAAITEFSQHGFAGASTQGIAERVGLTQSTLHYYIENKEALYAEIFGDLMARWKKRFDFDGESEEPAHILARYIRQKLRFAHAY